MGCFKSMVRYRFRHIFCRLTLLNTSGQELLNINPPDAPTAVEENKRFYALLLVMTCFKGSKC